MNSILGVLMEILKWSCAIVFGTRAVNMLNNKVLAEWIFFLNVLMEILKWSFAIVFWYMSSGYVK